jgi:hypothetical protein
MKPLQPRSIARAPHLVHSLGKSQRTTQQPVMKTNEVSCARVRVDTCFTYQPMVPGQSAGSNISCRQQPVGIAFHGGNIWVANPLAPVPYT